MAEVCAAMSAVLLSYCTCSAFSALTVSVGPHAGSGVVRIDPFRFVAGCRTKRLNQALSVLSLSLGFF